MISGFICKDADKLKAFEAVLTSEYTSAILQYSIFHAKNAVLGRAYPIDSKSVSPQFFSHPELNIVCVAEGRVDNRAALALELGVPPSSKLSDRELLFKAYCQWGKNCATHILGDWILAIYNTLSDEVFIARDQHGGTSLYFYCDNGIFAFSSSIKHLPPLLRPLQINLKEVVGRLCSWQYEDNQTTIFQHIYKLAGGHTLSYKTGQVNVEKYWFPERVPLRHYKNHENYSEELFEITQEAIRCRLISDKPIASMLSGGFDSGTVSVLAAELLGEQTLTTWSHIPLFTEQLKPSDANYFMDEVPYIEATTAMRHNIKSLKIRSEQMSPLDGIAKFIDCHNTIVHGASNLYWMMDIFQKVSEQKFGVLLSGDQGNAALSYKGIAYLLPATHPYMRSHIKPFLKDKIARPLLKGYLDAQNLKRYLKNNLVDSLVNQSALEAVDLYQIAKTDFVTGFQSPQEHILKFIQQSRYYQSGSERTNYFGFSYRDPTADIRIMEYALSIPNTAYFDKQGNNKQVIRRMMKGRLPDKVLNETKTGAQSADIYFRLQKDFPRLEGLMSDLDKNETFKFVVDTQKLKKMFNDIKTGKITDRGIINYYLKLIMFGMFLEYHHIK
jgi:asparagine synthase (glutamine-hydrolysing)